MKMVRNGHLMTWQRACSARSPKRPTSRVPRVDEEHMVLLLPPSLCWLLFKKVSFIEKKSLNVYSIDRKKGICERKKRGKREHFLLVLYHSK